MKALLHIVGSPEWPQTLQAPPWPLLPVGNRPLLEYWLELCVDLGIETVQIVMNDFAAEIEMYAGNGERWGLNIHYGFEKDGRDPLDYLRRMPENWAGGLLHLRGPVFPARTESYDAPVAKEKLCGLLSNDDQARFMIARTPAEVSAYLNEPLPPCVTEDLGISPVVLTSAKEFFRLNQRMVNGEGLRYLTPGYQITSDNCHIGANTVIPLTAIICPPVMIGDNCRIGDMTTVGPCAIIGNNIVIDQQTEIDHCVILDGSYIGHNMEIRQKIISKSHLYDVDSEVDIHMPDPWLLGSTESSETRRDAPRAVIGRILALAAVLLMAVPYWILLLTCKNNRTGEQQTLEGVHGKSISLPANKTPAHTGLRSKLFHGLSLDFFPKLVQVLCGRLWLCGHSVWMQKNNAALENELPRYLPAAISYEDIQPETDPSDSLYRANAFYYLEVCSPLEDISIFFNFLAHRFMTLWAE